MSAGQMLEDVQLAVQDRCPVDFYGRMGGVMPLPDEILEALRGVAFTYRGLEEGVESRYL
jgi:2-oxoglutarate/2-oxoacid ferredoxin oxidoreductase subunit alpha